MSMTSIVISVGDVSLAANLEDNATSKALIARLPISLPMLDLYGHELVHRFAEPLPISTLTECTPQRGDIVYWTPRNALALFYADGTEQFADIQPVGHVTSGLDSFDQRGDITVSFALSSTTGAARQGSA